MTLFEKARELGLPEGMTYQGRGCPCDHPELNATRDDRLCTVAACVECWGREYQEPEQPKNVVHDTLPQSRIKDSGDRTQFPSGAVRDMHEGKGRFDLLPMCVLMRLAKHYEAGCLKYGDRNWETGIPCHSFADSAMRHLVKYMDGQNDEDHLIAAIWNLCGLAWTEEKKPELMDIPARLALRE